MKISEFHARLEKLEKKAIVMERLMWYIAGVLSIKFGSEAIPLISAALN